MAHRSNKSSRLILIFPDIFSNIPGIIWAILDQYYPEINQSLLHLHFGPRLLVFIEKIKTFSYSVRCYGQRLTRVCFYRVKMKQYECFIQSVRYPLQIPFRHDLVAFSLGVFVQFEGSFLGAIRSKRCKSVWSISPSLCVNNICPASDINRRM